MPTHALVKTAPRIRIAVVEGQELFREGICLLLEREDGYDVVGRCSSWEEAVALVEQARPDVLLMGIGPEDGGRLDRLSQLLALSEEMKILLIARSPDTELHCQAMRLGVSGVLVQDSSPELLVKAVGRVHEGETWLDRSTTASLLRELSPRGKNARRDPEEQKIKSLTDREREVIQLLGKGYKNKQIAAALFISDITVHHHLTSIYAKLGVGDRFDLLIYAYRRGLAAIPR
ncbi:MAG: response regulator transcription factor [Acidobacteriota bacterium]|jgi:DNA-binding NarL/FixJ family response regulator|nr:response regulator transcription factor [Acidobacteriota bacterium]